jgi:Uma2 family endonuclease
MLGWEQALRDQEPAMTVHPGTLMSKTEFLDWVERQPSKYELVGGRPVMMVGATLRHQRICEGFRDALRNALPRRSFDITVETFAVDVANGIRFPDVQVFERARDGGQRACKTPLLIVEVLSPSSLADDFRAKADEYLALPSLQAYVIAAGDEARLWVFQREDGAFPIEPVMIETDGRLDLPALGIAVDVDAIYQDVF